MQRISPAHLQTFAQQAHDNFVAAMAAHLHTHFPALAWSLTPDELRDHINACIERAARYQLTSQRQVCRYLNLAATYGWNFDGDPERSWMREILTDSSLAQPGDRLDRLVQSCLHRQGIEAQNLALRQQLGLQPAQPPQQPAHDYLGPQRADRTVEPTTDASIFSLNPLSYHLSRSLWQDEEFLPASTPALSPALAWQHNSHPLMRTK
ncbi:hypothetical protein RugamoR64_12890 [Duganella rhizosphaerae]|uniref:hypothetical protein n=1 Tax=Duganella rhizosphaerae TaxID=2885763 RepID=UPI0030E9D067